LESESAYAVTKAEGEQPCAAFQRGDPAPSIIFGPEDGFFNKFAGMARFLPLCRWWAAATPCSAYFFVGDVAQAILVALSRQDGRTYELGATQQLFLQGIGCN